MGVGQRLIRSAVLAGVAGVMLSGCMALDVTTAVSATGTFTGDMTVTFDRQAVQEFGITDLSQAQEQLGTPEASGDKVSVTWSETAAEFVQTVSFVDATPAEVEAVTTTEQSSTDTGDTFSTSTSMGFPLEAVVRDGDMVVSLSESASDVGSEAGVPAGTDIKSTGKLARMLFGDSAVTMAITMPGDISQVTGAIPDAAGGSSQIIVEQPDPRSFEMSAPFAELAVLEESSRGKDGLVITSAIDQVSASPVATAPASSPVATTSADPADPPTASGVPVAAWAAGAAGLLAVIVIAAVLLARRNRGSSDSDPDARPQDPPGQA